MTIETISAETYAKERALVARAEAYLRKVTSGKRNYLTKEETAHPDYACADNAMRGRVEQYELIHEHPERIFAYLGEGGEWVTTWTGDRLGYAWKGKPYRSNFGDERIALSVTIGGVLYHGTNYGGVGAYCRLRKAKGA